MHKMIQALILATVFAIAFHGVDLKICPPRPRTWLQCKPMPQLVDIPEESVTVRFYYHCHEADPDFLLLPGAYRYNAVNIPIKYLWDEFPRLMYAHTGISINDLWLWGDKLYVDLHYSEWDLFDQGSAGSFDRGERLIRTIASLPGVASFEILVGGKHGVETSHFSFDWVAIVENGEITGFAPMTHTSN